MVQYELCIFRLVQVHYTALTLQMMHVEENTKYWFRCNAIDKIIKLSSDVHLVVEVPHPNPVGFSRNLGELDDPGGLEDIVDPGIALTNSQIMVGLPSLHSSPHSSQIISL